MKISLNNISNYHINPSNAAKAETASSVKKPSKNFDELIIQSDTRQVEEKKFTESLSRSISAEVRETSSDRIDVLKAQVANGTYPLDANLTASKLLLLQEGV